MRAAQYSRYGAPSVIHLGTVDVPEAGHGEVLIAVHGTSVNPVDAMLRRGTFIIATGLRFPRGVGADFAGDIVALGEGVVGFEIGERVWGFLGGVGSGSSGAAAEFVVAHADRISRAPSDVSLVDAAALPMVGVTALLALRDHLTVSAGTRLLIRGAAGGVGTSAVQLGKAMGAHVTALAGANSLEFLRELGADAALDYHTHGPDQLGAFDAILDLTGIRMLAYRALLPRHGRMVTTAIDQIGPIAVSIVYGTKRIRAFSARPSARLLADVAGFVARGELHPVIESVLPLAGVAVAHAALEAGGGTGKYVISVRD